MSLEIIIGADVSPALDSATHKSATPKLDSGLSEIWQKAEARIFNLQSPLTGDAQALAALSPTGISLCSSRIAEAGADGIEATRAALKANKIAFSAQGKTSMRLTSRSSSCGMVCASASMRFARMSARARRSTARAQIRWIW